MYNVFLWKCISRKCITMFSQIMYTGDVDIGLSEYSLKCYSVPQCTSWQTESEHNNVIGSNKLLFTCIPSFTGYVTLAKPLTVFSTRLLVIYTISFWSGTDFKTWSLIKGRVYTYEIYDVFVIQIITACNLKIEISVSEIVCFFKIIFKFNTVSVSNTKQIRL